MGNNYFTPYSNTSPTSTPFTVAGMGAPLSSLDQVITYGTKRPIIHCNGDISWAGGTLTWGGTINIHFNRSDGQAILNTISAGSISLSDNEFAYVTLSETNNASLTMSKASVSTGAASNFLAVGILVMAYRNTTNDELYCVNMPQKLAEGRYLDGREQAITCADSVAIDWSKGASAAMTFDRSAVTFTFSNMVNGQVYRLLLIQGGGNGTVTWPTVKWAGKTLPVLQTASGAEDVITLVKYSSGIYGGLSSDHGTP